MNKKKILIIATGGTFASVKTENGLKPEFNIEEILNFFPEAKTMAEIYGFQLFNLDSTNIHPKHWTILAKTISDNYGKYDGFIVIHGTDTMQYSSSALSFALRGISKPVVFTGSVYPLGEPNSDAKNNFLDSVYVASSDCVKGVVMCFHGDVINGNRARKIKNEATKITNENIKVYSSINSYLIGEVNNLKFIKNEKYLIDNQFYDNIAFEFLPKFDLAVGHIKLYPGLESNILDMYKSKKAILIEAFGPGNIPFDYSNWLEKIYEFKKEGILIFVSTQNSFGEANMNKYEVGQLAIKAGAIPCYDILPETAIIKLMWIFGNYPEYSYEEVKNLFLTNLCGEISNTNLT